MDILEWGSWRVLEDDSKEEKSGSEVGSCVEGSRMRKPVPPLMPSAVARVIVRDTW